MNREEAYNYLREKSSDTDNGPMVNIFHVRKAIESVTDDEKLIEKALYGAYECEGNCLDWMQLDDAEWFVDIALGIKDEYTYF